MQCGSGRALRSDAVAHTTSSAGPRLRLRVSRVQVQGVAHASPATATVMEDKWLASNMPQLVLEQPMAASLQSVRQASLQSLAGMRLPTTRNEEYRFTDLSPLLRAKLTPANGAAAVSAEVVQGLVPSDVSYVVLVNGVFSAERSHLSMLPPGVYVGGLAGAPTEAVAKLGLAAGVRGGPFVAVNGAAAHDVLVVALPAHATLSGPLYVLHLSSGSTSQGFTSFSAPRMLLHAGPGSSCTLIEEWTGLEAVTAAAQSTQDQAQQGLPYFACAVAEVYLEADAQVTHGYAVREAPGSVHIRATLVEQAETSSYTLTETRLGGALTRHDVVIEQKGPRTKTNMSHFLLAGPGQLHDLHTKLNLEFPEGSAHQLHKCIVTSATGRGVFDGNVRVGRFAQRSDAGQLSRNLLLAPRATVNVKPNLQIVADDVKCTHGCAISDLSEEELFYFRARGISALSARQSLVASFGAEVTRNLGLPSLVARVAADVRATLATVDLAVLQ